MGISTACCPQSRDQGFERHENAPDRRNRKQYKASAKGQSDEDIQEEIDPKLSTYESHIDNNDIESQMNKRNFNNEQSQNTGAAMSLDNEEFKQSEPQQKLTGTDTDNKSSEPGPQIPKQEKIVQKNGAEGAKSFGQMADQDKVNQAQARQFNGDTSIMESQRETVHGNGFDQIIGEDEQSEWATMHGDYMRDFIWDGPEDSDEEIPEMVALKNDQEKEMGIKFSKNGIIEYVTNFLQHESVTFSDDTANAKMWQEKLSVPGIKMFLKSGGSEFSKTQPFIRSESTYNQKYTMEKLLNCIHNPEHSTKWDKLIKVSRRQQVIQGVNCCSTQYLCNKQQYSICSRDFFEKGFNFFHKGKFYRYSSSVQDSDQPGPNGESALCPSPNKNTVRASTLINCQLMERLPDGKIQLQVITQCDFKIKVPQFMMTTFLPKATKGWYDSLTKYYNKNHKNM